MIGLPPVAELSLLVVLGIGVAIYGSMVGAGGGFVLMPILLMLYPGEPPNILTTISLVAVALNALSGTIAYARRGHIDIGLACYLGLASVPGAVLGASVTHWLPRGWFDLLLGLFLYGLLAALMCFKPGSHAGVTDTNPSTARHSSPDFRLTTGLGFASGLISSLAGIGGGPILVPLLLLVLRLPVAVATATSLFVITLGSSTGILTHVVAGDFSFALERALFISFGVVLGAQIGARLAHRLRPRVVIWLLIVGIALVAGQLMVTGVLTVVNSLQWPG